LELGLKKDSEPGKKTALIGRLRTRKSRTNKDVAGSSHHGRTQPEKGTLKREGNVVPGKGMLDGSRSNPN